MLNTQQQQAIYEAKTIRTACSEGFTAVTNRYRSVAPYHRPAQDHHRPVADHHGFAQYTDINICHRSL